MRRLLTGILALAGLFYVAARVAHVEDLLAAEPRHPAATASSANVRAAMDDDDSESDDPGSDDSGSDDSGSDDSGSDDSGSDGGDASPETTS